MLPSFAPISDLALVEELTARLQRKERGGIPSRLLVAALLMHQPKGDYDLYMDALDALARRLASAVEEGLVVATLPRGNAWSGRYQVSNPTTGVRPHQVAVYGAVPFYVACSCDDYRKSSLGLCKHGVAVLRQLMKTPRKWSGFLSPTSKATTAPLIGWDCVKPLEGEGDWLSRVWIREPSRLVRGKLSRWIDPHAVTTHRLGFEAAYFPGDIAEPSERLAALRRLHEVVGTQGEAVDPAVEAWLDEAIPRETSNVASWRALGHTPKRRLESLLKGFRLELYPYQREAVERSFRSPRMLLADDMGLGKTIQSAAIAHATTAAKLVKRILVVAPASLKDQWAREWARATPTPIEIVEGTPAQRRRRYDTTQRGALIVNYEQVPRDIDRINEWKPDLVIVDEAQRIKNWATVTAQSIKQIQAPRHLALTGTPLENRLDELASLMDWIDPHALAPKWRLRAAHMYAGEDTNDVWGMRRLDTLRQRLAPVLLRRRRDEILKQLPARTDTMRVVAMTPAQRALHDDLKLPIAALVARARTRPLRHPEFLRLMTMLTSQRILANGVAQYSFETMWPGIADAPCDADRLAELSMPKLEVIRELVSSIVIDQGRKMVIFSQWRRALNLVRWATQGILESAGLRSAYFSGEESMKQRTKNVVQFHDDPDLRVLLCTDAGGVGLNLQRAASCIVHFELPWNPAVFEQRVGRVHRLGQPEPVDVYSLVSDPSIEGRIAATLTTKRSIFKGVFDGQDDSVAFESATGFIDVVSELVDTSVEDLGGIEVADPSGDGADLDAVTQSEKEEPKADEDRHLSDAVDFGARAQNPSETSEAETREPSAPRGASEMNVTAEGALSTQAAAAERVSGGQPSSHAARGLPTPEALRGMFSRVVVERREDGGIRIEAPPEAASSLSELFAGFAALLANAVAPTTNTVATAASEAGTPTGLPEASTISGAPPAPRGRKKR
jgi:superfamily II DNA or RNA helicase